MRYPPVIATSVVRSAHQGESHGGVYLVDLESGTYEQVVDWNRGDIEWTGRGHDRGLRGIAFWGGRTYVAASDAVLVYDYRFRLVASYRSPYLRHAHEIDVDGNTLWMTSTGFDSLLAFDLRHNVFTTGLYLGLGPLGRVRRKLAPARPPRLRRFDPLSTDGPRVGDTVHLNTVFALDGDVFCAGTRLASLLLLGDGALVSYARIPLRTHNARPFGDDGVLTQDTSSDRVLLTHRDGRERESWALPTYDRSRLLHRDLPADHARQAFGRGLCTAPGGLVIAGSSPSTISVFTPGVPEPLRSVNLTLDVRNAIHGLEVYPYPRAGEAAGT